MSYTLMLKRVVYTLCRNRGVRGIQHTGEVVAYTVQHTGEVGRAGSHLDHYTVMGRGGGTSDSFCNIGLEGELKATEQR